MLIVLHGVEHFLEYLYNIFWLSCKRVHRHALAHMLGVFTIRPIALSHALGSFGDASASRISGIVTGSFAKYRADVRLETSVKTGGGSTDFSGHRCRLIPYLKRWIYHKAFCDIFASSLGSRHAPANEDGRPIQEYDALDAPTAS
jgi:hypothetical protein